VYVYVYTYPVTSTAPLFQNEHRTTAWLGTHTHTLQTAMVIVKLSSSRYA
jgi:hypothetical protein